MNRIDRLTAILTHLQSRRLVKAEDIARRFDISLRTVYRDIRALNEAGVPINGEAGVGYSIMDGYRLPPVMFTQEEAMALLVAEKMAQIATDQHNSEQIQSAMIKIRSVLHIPEKKTLENIDDNIAIRSFRQSGSIEDQPENILQKILGSIASEEVIHIQYSTIQKQEYSERDIEPVGIYFSHEYWYLIAYCQLRQAYRTFRLDRILIIRETGKKYLHHHPTLKTYLEQLQRKERLVRVVVQIDKSIVHYFREEKYKQGLILEHVSGELVEMTFMVSGIYRIAHWLMQMAPFATVMEPPELIDHMVDMAEKMIVRQKKVKSS